MPDIRIVPGSSIMSFTSSLNFTERITQDASGSLNLYGSGSTGRTELFSIDGGNGRLFTVSDDLSDSLFSVNTIAGLPVIEAFADNTVNIGQYSAPPIKVTGSLAIITGSLFGTASFAATPTVQGVTGAQGTTGTQGTTGAQGIQGINAGITSYTNPADNRVITSVSSTTINGESNLTFDGSTLGVTGIVTPTGGVNYAIGSLSTANVNGEIAYWGGGSVTAGNVYYYDSSLNWTAADADSESTAKGLLGIAMGTGTASTVGMLLRGHARFTGNSNYTNVSTAGAQLYLSSTAGNFSQTAPSSAGQIVRIIGFVYSQFNDQIYFCPDNTYITLQ